MDNTTPAPRWPFTVALLLVLLVAAGLRLYRLPELPVGLHYDEAANGILAGEIARGTRTPVFIPSYTGKEVLFFYWAGLWMRLLGVTPLALRLSAATAGLATVAATVWAVRELLHGAAALPFHPDGAAALPFHLNGQRGANWVALLTGAFLATSFWHLILSRYGFRAVAQPLLQALTVASLWRGLRLSSPPLPPKLGGKGRGEGVGKGGLPWLLLAGLLCGLSAYTYLAARAFPIPLAAALLTLILADRGHRRARLGQVAIFVAVAALTLTPLAHYWLTHPGSFLTRTQQVAAASWAAAWDGIRACLGMFFLRGDPYIRFNLPHRPLFDPITAILFLLGLIALILNVKRQTSNVKSAAPRPPVSLSPRPPVPLSPRLPVSSSPLPLASCIFLLTYLPIMLLPSALAVGDVTPSNLRAAGLLPFIYLFPALGLWAILNAVHRSLAAELQPALRDPLLPTPYSLPPASCLPLPASCLLLPASCLLLLALLTPITAVAYFRDWASSAALYHAADGDLADVAATLNQAGGSTELAETMTATTPYVASIHYRHPTLAFLAEDYGAIRWLTGGRTVVFPAEGDALLIFPRSASQDLAWVRSVLPDGSLVSAASPLAPDGTPAFHAYRVGPSPDLRPTHPLTANLAHVALVLGYDVVGEGEPRSGESAEVVVWFRVLNTPDRGETAGEWIVDHLSIPVAPGAPPGDYTIHFSLYSSGAGSTLPALDDTGRYAGTGVGLDLRLARAATPALPVPSVAEESKVKGPPSPNILDALDIRTRLDAHAEGLTLLGANLDTSNARPGERLYLTLFWWAEEPPLPSYDVVLTLGDVTLYMGAPVHGTYPTSDWVAGELVVDRYDPRLPRDVPPGDYPLRLRLGAGSVRDRSERAGDQPEHEHWQSQPLDLGVVTVQAMERAFDVPPISHPLTATLGDQVELLGYDLLTPIPGPTAAVVAPGDTLTLILYWRALAEMDEPYTVFTHLLAPDGSMTGQWDSHPVGGAYPTDLWLAGEVVTDVREIPVRAGAAAGAHRLEVGMYVAETGARLPLIGTPDDAVVLQTVTVTGP